MEACGECHVEEREVWKRTEHAQGFKTLHREEAATAIADKMGFRLIKRESLCLSCHYTPILVDGQSRAASGVSCESCHGAGADWIDLHNDYGGKGFTHANETPEHRARRLEQSRAAGMRRPSDLYPVVKSCFGCHTVPYERLVNVGGHSTGSGDFELVGRLAEIRHNFLSALRGGSRENVPPSAERRRLIYVLGRAQDLESSLRGVAAASEDGIYVKAMIRRSRLAVAEVRAIARRGELPELDAMIATVREVEVTLGNGPALVRAADAIGEAARSFLQRHDGTRLARLDPLIDGTAEDDFFEDGAVAEAGVATASEATANETTASDDDTTGRTPPATPQNPVRTATETSRSVAIPAVGEKKSRIRPRPADDTVGPSRCTSCHRHQPQNAWWLSDKHYASVEPFFAEDPKNVKIARLYGTRPSAMARGDQVCMDCHGSVVSGREGREVQDGVGCESCHGAAGRYLEPHQEGDPALGLGRPGYVQALELGMVELRDLGIRARVCTGCHYVTDPRLISAGHPPGKSFDYVEGMKKIRHWDEPPESADTLRAAFGSALKRRGAIPDVRLAQLPASRPRELPETTETPAKAGGEPVVQPPIYDPRPPGRPAATVNGSAPPRPRLEAVELPPFPEIDESASVEDVMRLLQARLELLYRTVGQSR